MLEDGGVGHGWLREGKGTIMCGPNRSGTSRIGVHETTPGPPSACVEGSHGCKARPLCEFPHFLHHSRLSCFSDAIGRSVKCLPFHLISCSPLVRWIPFSHPHPLCCSWPKHPLHPRCTFTPHDLAPSVRLLTSAHRFRLHFCFPPPPMRGINFQDDVAPCSTTTANTPPAHSGNIPFAVDTKIDLSAANADFIRPNTTNPTTTASIIGSPIPKPHTYPPINLKTCDVARFDKPVYTINHDDAQARSINVLLAKAALARAESKAVAATAKLLGALETAQGVLDASIEYTSALEQEKADLANRQADLEQQRRKTADSKQRVQELALTPDKENDLHYEIYLRPTDDPKFEPWYWRGIAQKVSHLYSEATEVYREAVQALEGAEAGVKASEECLRAVAALEAKAKHELSEAVKTAEALGAASERAHEEAAQLTVSLKLEIAARAKVEAAEAEAAKTREEAEAAKARAEAEAAEARAEAEAAKAKRDDEEAAASKDARARNSRRRCLGERSMAARGYNIKARGFITPWEAYSIFDKCKDFEVKIGSNVDGALIRVEFAPKKNNPP